MNDIVLPKEQQETPLLCILCDYSAVKEEKKKEEYFVFFLMALW
jgi:hypothetical protein